MLEEREGVEDQSARALDAETRAALERAVEWLSISATPRYKGEYPDACSQLERDAKVLQALLDEKGGGCPFCGAPIVRHALNPKYLTCSGCGAHMGNAPPDSAAKIADDIHRVIADIRYHLSAPLRDGLDKDLRTIAARVEALGLEPSEREVVRRAEECPDCGGSGFIEGRYGAQGPLTRETCQTCLPDQPAGNAEAERLWNEDKWNEDRLWQEMMASKRREE